MAGIYGFFSKQENPIKNIYNYFYSSSLNNILKEEYQYKNYIYGRSVINKFLDDRVLYEDENLIIGFEGLFFNKEHIKSFDTLKSWYQRDGIDFVENIDGQFCGFIYDKNLDKLFIFNDHLSTKPIYYYKSDEIFIFASELKVITKLLSKLSIKKELDYDAVYSMLTFGYMLNNITYEKNTKKLNYSTIMEIDSNFNIKENQYFCYAKKENFKITKNEIIEEIDKLLTQSVKRCWSKDDEYNYKHYSFLSGGLDSRVNLFLAKELGYKDVITMTFSQSGSSDEKIAQKISNKENFEHLFYSLDNGKFLEKDLNKFILANDGLNNLTGVASGYAFLSMLNHKKFGALHSGQIGDLLFGSYVKKDYSIEKGMLSNQYNLLNKISFMKDYKKSYDQNPEIYGYEERVINGTLNGDRTISHLVDQLSPFYNRKLIEFCLTIPDKYKKDEMIYLDWFNTKHKNIAKYQWESAGVIPTNIHYIKLAKFLKRYKNGILRRIGFNINDMNPFDIWLRENKNIIKNLDDVYNKHIENVDKELKNILNDMYNTSIKFSYYGRNNKFIVVSLLLAVDLHFKEN